MPSTRQLPRGKLPRNLQRRILVLGLGAALFLVVGAAIWPRGERHTVALVRASGAVEGAPDDLFVNVHVKGEKVRFVVRDYFYSSGVISTPYLTLDSLESATLHLDVEREFSLIATKCEFLRQLVIEASASLLSGRIHLTVMNHDSDHVMTKKLNRQGDDASAQSREQFIAAKNAC